jgi:four helix bundle protein
MRISKFEDLPIWKLSLKITKEIYDVTYKDKFLRDFSLKDQIRRAVVSISSNIVEGFEKNNNNEFIRYLKISKGSIGEVRNQLYIALTIKYINEIEFQTINDELIILSNQVGGLLNYLSQKRRNKEFLIR